MKVLAHFRPVKKDKENKLNSREGKLRFAFKMYDTDNDELISKDELLGVLQMMVGDNIRYWFSFLQHEFQITYNDFFLFQTVRSNWWALLSVQLLKPTEMETKWFHSRNSAVPLKGLMWNRRCPFAFSIKKMLCFYCIFLLHITTSMMLDNAGSLSPTHYLYLPWDCWLVLDKYIS